MGLFESEERNMLVDRASLDGFLEGIQAEMESQQRIFKVESQGLVSFPDGSSCDLRLYLGSRGRQFYDARGNPLPLLKPTGLTVVTRREAERPGVATEVVPWAGLDMSSAGPMIFSSRQVTNLMADPAGVYTVAEKYAPAINEG